MQPLFSEMSLINHKTMSLFLALVHDLNCHMVAIHGYKGDGICA